MANNKEDRDAARLALNTLADQPLSPFKEFLSPSTCRNARVASGLLLQFGSLCRTQPDMSEKLMLDADWSISKVGWAKALSAQHSTGPTP